MENQHFSSDTHEIKHRTQEAWKMIGTFSVRMKASYNSIPHLYTYMINQTGKVLWYGIHLIIWNIPTVVVYPTWNMLYPSSMLDFARDPSRLWRHPGRCGNVCSADQRPPKRWKSLRPQLRFFFGVANRGVRSSNKLPGFDQNPWDITWIWISFHQDHKMDMIWDTTKDH